MRRSMTAVRVIFLLGALGGLGSLPTAWAQEPQFKSTQGDWDSLKPVAEDDNVELRASDGSLEEVTKRVAYFKSTAAGIHKEYLKRGFAEMPKWRLGIIDERADTPRGETPTADLTLISIKLLSEPEAELTSTLTHEAFHIVQNNSYKAMESANELFTKWEDESSASWMQYKLCPDSGIVHARSIDFFADDFESSYFGWGSMHHPYSCFNFWCYLDELYGAEDLLHQIYINQADNKPKPPKAANFPEALQRIIRTRKDKKGRVHSVPDLFVEYLIRYAWKKDAEPFAAILKGDDADGRKALLLSRLGKPGELAVGSVGRVSAEIPYVEGKERKRKKIFEVVDADRYGIAKQYDIKSAARGDDEKKVILEVSVAGPAGKARLLVFPYGENGLMDPVIGSTGQPAQVDKWDTLRGAIVLLVDVGQDQIHKFKVTAEMKATPRWNLAATENPPTGLTLFNMRSLRLNPKEQPSDEDKQKLEGKWFPVTIVLDEKTLYTYGGFRDAVGYIWPPHIMVKPGDHSWHITTLIGEEAVTLDGASEIKLSGESQQIINSLLDQAEKSLKQDQAQLDDPNVPDKETIQKNMALSRRAIAQYLYAQGEFEKARANLDLALERLPDDLIANKLAGDICLANGDIERYVGYYDKCLRLKDDYRGMRHYQHAAEAFVLYRNDLKTAWKYQARDDAQLQSFNQKPQRPMYPKLDDPMLKADWQKH